MKFSILVFISGRGSNLKSILENADNYQVSGILSNNKDALGISYGKENNIPTYVFDKSDYSSLKDQKKAILEKVKELNPDLIALAGFMQIIQPEFIEEFYGKLVNIHPSLLPKFQGLDTHKRALEAKETHHGCSVHYVDTGIDTGPLIAQAKVDIIENDTEDSLSSRVLDFEHKIYPWALNMLASKQISLVNGKLTYQNEAITEAKNLGFKIFN